MEAFAGSQEGAKRPCLLFLKDFGAVVHNEKRLDILITEVNRARCVRVRVFGHVNGKRADVRLLIYVLVTEYNRAQGGCMCYALARH